MNRRVGAEQGASAVEYGLLIAGIAALIVVAVFAIGPVVSKAFTDTCDEIKTAGSATTQTCTPAGDDDVAPESEPETP